MNICSDVPYRVGASHIKMCSDVRVGTQHMKMCSDVKKKAGETAHKNELRCSY